MKAYLILDDGSVFEGASFGSEKSVSGEVVFSTAMTGYTESLTDPSYLGQILTLTYPLIGNYGIPKDDASGQLGKYFESDMIGITGLVVSDYSQEFSHWNGFESLGSWLKEREVPAITGIDTRALTKILREKGTMLGKIVFDKKDKIQLYDPSTENLVEKASCKEIITYGEGKKTLVLIDCGVKYTIIRALLKRDVKILRVPFDYDYTKMQYDGLFISNGPGDPMHCQKTVEHIKQAINIGKPICGICLGNQLLGLASGAKTYKLKYGHRSHNQPVRMANTDRCFVTSQNHGYAIQTDSIGKDWEELFINLNDGTNEGIRHKNKPFFSAQFHPEAASGPTDTEFLFDDFIKMLNA